MKVTPMMEQYFAAKEKHPDAILFFRMGDFYEMFFDDAVTVSQELDLTLTARHKGESNETPMSGIPHHAADGYIAKLVEKGYKVAVCDQLEAPSAGKKIVRRGVTRVVTPGVVLNPDHIDARSNNYLVALCAAAHKKEYGFGIACIDASTGEFKVTEVSSIDQVYSEVGRLSPREVLIPQDEQNIFKDLATHLNGAHIRATAPQTFDRKTVLDALAAPQENINTLAQQSYFADMDTIKGFFASIQAYGFNAEKCVSRVVAAVMAYLVYTQQGVMAHIRNIECYRVEDFLVLDDATRANLELTETLMGGKRKGSLISVIDDTVTSMGARRLRSWLMHPLVDVKRIRRRHIAVGELKDNLSMRDDLRASFKGTYDIERLIGRLSGGNANARDMLSLRRTLDKIPEVKSFLDPAQSALLRIIRERLDPCEELQALLARAIVDDPPATIREGGLFLEGYHEELDELISLTRDGKDWLLRYETEERQRTGITSLKIKFNKVFGYFLEVTRANLHLVPDNYIRKQTLANSERFFTEDLKEYEEKVLNASDRRKALESRLFEELRQEVATYLGRLRQSAYLVSSLDVLGSLAETASRHGYTCPEINDEGEIEIVDGRHPVVEQTLRHDERFVPNSVLLNDDESSLLLITGPNMAGKSTIIRQVAIMSLMAQMGSFVPATRAKLGVVDKIFSRVGASDNLAKGQSTFMVEMTETAHILKNATPRSLIILDEIGRGTSTYDGLSIAWAVTEFLHNEVGAKTLFATHYHELTSLAETMKGIKNHNVACKELKDDVIFLRKLIPGPANKSYGIQVGKLAGLPQDVVNRAKEILASLESTPKNAPVIPSHDGTQQISAAVHVEPSEGGVLPAELKEALLEVKNTAINTMSPIEAMNLIYKLQQRLQDAQL